jgi:CRISPR-associated exonuclease Cas4
LVKLGRILHEERYHKRLKEIQLDRIKLDFVENGNEIHEIKRSKKMENAHLYQLL